MTTIYFVRHGSVYNPKDIFYGRLPRFKLSTVGINQAQEAALFFRDKPIQAIYSSPMLRARQTARVIARFLGQAKVVASAYLNEVRTPFDGCLISDLLARNWDLYTGSAFPYEQPGDVFKRSYKFIRHVLKVHPNQQVVAVTHGDTIVFLSLWANGYAVNFENKSLIEHGRIPIRYPAPASITRLTWKSNQGLPEYSYETGKE
jgi:broad specificity phosphatase PhoE